MRAAGLACAICLLAGAAFGQDVRAPSLLVRGDDRGERVPLRISEYHADVLIAGGAASTTLTLVFENERNQILEGRLILPIGRGKTISRFAMDVNGKIREGVVVERSKARRVFEEIVSRRVDPGLLSWVDGYNYEARVFPIPRKGTKTIVVRYEELLPFRGGRQVRYSLPVDLGVRFDHFTARVRFANPDTELIQWQTSLVEFPEAGDVRGIAEIDERDYLPEAPLRIGFNVPEDCVVSAPREGGGRFFFSRPRITTARRDVEIKEKIALVWDNSGSSTKRDQDRELSFLDAYLGGLGDVSVELRLFGSEASPPENFEIKGGDWAALKGRLKRLKPDGGTDFSAVDWSSIDAEAILVFSDGAGTLGKTEFESPNAPVFPVVSHQEFAGDSLLERLAAQSGGRWVSLQGSLEGALDTMQSTPARMVAAEGRGEGWSDLLPDGATFNQRPLVAGVFDRDTEGEVSLRLGGVRPNAPGSETLVVPAVAEDVEKDPALEALVYQMWVRAKLQSMETQRRTRWREIADLSAQAGLVTPDSSLLVLDELRDYVNNEIPPPPTEPELLAKYNDQVREERPPRPEDQFAAVWKRFDQWYANRYPWLEETNLRLAKNGASYVKSLVRRRPEREDFAADLKRLKPMVAKAEDLKLEYLRLVGGEQAARDAWLAKAIALQAELEPMKLKYGRAYLRQVAAVREVLRDYAEETDDWNDWDPFGSGGSSDDPFSSGSPSGLRSGDDPFSTASSGGGATPSGRKLTLGDARAASIQSDAKWQPDAPHLASMKAATDEAGFVEAYFERREFLARDPLFFVDAGDLAAERGYRALAARIFSNLAELKLDDVRLLRMLAYRLDTHGQHDTAREVYRQILSLVPDDALAKRDLALSLTRTAHLQEGFDILWAIVSSPRDSSLNAVLLADLQALLASDTKRVVVLPEGAEGLRAKPAELDLRVVATWDTDAVELDLVVIEPSNGEAGPGVDATLTGGQISGVTRGGFGPEQYLIKRALPGTYTIKALVRPGRKRGSLPAPTMVYLDITKGFGTAKPERKRVAVRAGRGETVAATVTFGAEDVEN